VEKMKRMKMGEPIKSDLDVFSCPNCKNRLLLLNDQEIFRAREITMYCQHCKNTYVLEIHEV